MSCIEQTLCCEPDGGWQLVDVEQLSWDSMTEEEEEEEDDDDYVSCDEWDVVTECRPALYAQLCARADAPFFHLRSDDQQREQDVDQHVEVDVSGSTLGVFLQFPDGATRDVCRYMLQKCLRVSAEAWWDAEPHETRGVNSCECDGSSLVLLLCPDALFSGRFIPAELDRKVEALLGCPARAGGGSSVVLARASSISYEVISGKNRGDWLSRRRDVLGTCSGSVVSVPMVEL